jgi:hypothetical protein
MTVLDWLLDSDPSIRWQVLRDLTDQPAEVVAAERSRVASEGWGARLLALQAPDGQWGGDTYHPYFTSTHFTLLLLRDLGLDPDSEQARRAVGLVRDNVRFVWTETDSRPFFAGEIEICINGMVLALGAYFGEANSTLLEQVIDAQLEDGGWNCWAGEAWPDVETNRSSFNTTIDVLDGLLEYERAVGPDPVITRARSRGEGYLLERRMLRRLSTGELIKEDWTRFSFPPRWRYDVLRGLDYLRSAGVEPDDRIIEAIDVVLEKRDSDGRWAKESPRESPKWDRSGEVHFEMEEGEGKPSRWNTLRAMRVLNWSGHSDR